MDQKRIMYPHDFPTAIIIYHRGDYVYREPNIYFIRYGFCPIPLMHLIAGSLESAYSFIWASHETWGQGGGEPLGLL